MEVASVDVCWRMLDRVSIIVQVAIICICAIYFIIVNVAAIALVLLSLPSLTRRSMLIGATARMITAVAAICRNLAFVFATVVFRR